MRITLDTSKTLHGSRSLLSGVKDDRSTTHTCPVCGTKFQIGCALSEYCYQYKVRVFCRYNHMREYEKKHSKPSVERVAWQLKNGDTHDQKWLRRRITYCHQKIDEYNERLETMEGRQRSNALTQLHRWKDRLIEAQDHLKALG